MTDAATVTGLHAAGDFEAGTILASRFRLERLLGVGGMGVVWRAHDLDLDVPVALKLLRPEFALKPAAFERFRQELLLARQVASPHVLRIHDLARHGERWLICMDLVEGEALDKRLDRDGPLPVEQAVAIARQIAQGLEAAHARGVVHRDLKPANILLDADGAACISDFGVARSLGATGLTHTGSIVGTPDYLSPEQARGERVDPRSDLYALGLILYEMLTGRVPFTDGTPAENMARRMTRTPAPVSSLRAGLPAWLVRLVDRLLRPTPGHRFQSAAEVLRAIDQRRVPRRLGAQAASLTLIAAGSAAVFALLLLTGRNEPADIVAPTAPPLDRIVVLPVGEDLIGADQAAAYAELVRLWLSEAPGVAVADGERTAQAAAQLGSAAGDPEEMRRLTAARRSLRLLPVNIDGDWRWHARIEQDQRPPVSMTGNAGTGALPALAELLPLLAKRLDLPSPPPMSAPATPAALAAFGAGLRSHWSGEPTTALAGFRAATTADPGFAPAWLSLAEIAQRLAETAIALEAVENGLRVARTGTPAATGLTALQALIEGDPDTAAAGWRQRVELAPDDSLAILRLAEAEGMAGEFAAAMTRLQQLIARDGNDPRLWFQLGKLAILSGDARRAVDDYLLRAQVQYARGRNLFGQAEAVNALGVGYGRLGQTAEAEAHYLRAAQLRRSVGDRRGLATSLRNLAGIARIRGNFADARAQLGEARTLLEELGDRLGLAAVEREFGLLAEEEGDYGNALIAYRRALAAHEQTGNRRGLAETLNDIGFAHYQLGAYDSAQAFWEQTADAFERIEDTTGQVRAQQNLGLLAITRGRWSRARALLGTSLATAVQRQMAEEAAVSRRNLAELNLLQGRLAEAIDEIDQAEALFREREDLRGIADLELLRVQALLAAGAYARARQTLDALAQLLDQASDEQLAQAALVRAELALANGDVPAAQAALDTGRTAGAASGVRALIVHEALLAWRALGGDGEGPAGETAALGHVALRLAWLEQRMQRTLAAGDAAQALRLYREAQQLLRAGSYLRAWRLHALGAEAHAADGDAVAAAEASAAAREAWQALRAQVPEAWRAEFDAQALPAMLAEADREP